MLGPYLGKVIVKMGTGNLFYLHKNNIFYDVIYCIFKCYIDLQNMPKPQYALFLRLAKK